MGFFSKLLNKVSKKLHVLLPPRTIRVPLIAGLQSSSTKIITHAIKARGFTYGDRIAYLSYHDFTEIKQQGNKYHPLLRNKTLNNISWN